MGVAKRNVAIVKRQSHEVLDNRELHFTTGVMIEML
jgi:hypothetical protein